MFAPASPVSTPAAAPCGVAYSAMVHGTSPGLRWLCYDHSALIASTRYDIQMRGPVLGLDLQAKTVQILAGEEQPTSGLRRGGEKAGDLRDARRADDLAPNVDHLQFEK